MTTNVRALVRDTRNILSLITRSIDVNPQATSRITELEIIELLDITKAVCESRFANTTIDSGPRPERQGTAEGDHTQLYDSVRLDVIESTRACFADHNRRTGPVVQRFNTIGLYSIFSVLAQIAPERASTFIKHLTAAVHRDMTKIGVVDYSDSTTVIQQMTQLVKARNNRNRPPLTYAQRMVAINNAVAKYSDG